MCGEYTDKLKKSNCLICKPCANKYESEKRYKEKNRGRARYHMQQMFEEHILKLPKNPKPLKEHEWIDACRFFGGCAICGESTITSRMLFIPAKYGGKYTASNIIPVCEKCATEARSSHNVNPYNRYCQILRSGGCYFKTVEERMPVVYSYIIEKLWEEDDYYG
jgi:hypothetical protein